MVVCGAVADGSGWRAGRRIGGSNVCSVWLDIVVSSFLVAVRGGLIGEWFANATGCSRLLPHDIGIAYRL